MIPIIQMFNPLKINLIDITWHMSTPVPSKYGEVRAESTITIMVTRVWNKAQMELTFSVDNSISSSTIMLKLSSHLICFLI